MDRAEKYIRELRSSTSLMRKFAARYLKDSGDERAFGPLSDALHDEHPEVRREAAATLGHIGDRSVLEALKRACSDEDEKTAREAARAMEAIEKRFPGEEAPASDSPPAPPSTSRPKLDRETFLRSALGDTEALIAKRGYGYKVTVQLLDGRKQAVRLVYGKSDPEDDPILLLFTVCGEADPKRFHWALKANARIPYGALAVREVADREQLILIDTLLESDATQDQLRKIVLTLAEKGDLIEKKLFRTDVF